MKLSHKTIVQILQAFDYRRMTLVQYRDEAPKGAHESVKFWTDRIAELDTAEEEFTKYRYNSLTDETGAS